LHGDADMVNFVQHFIRLSYETQSNRATEEINRLYA
jgi:hypothetical protein